MTQEFRLARGGRIDRERVLNFRFDGVSYTGHPGDTLASALLANGVHLVARSFKYHRPRGILSAGVEEPNALVTLGEGARREPNVRATEAELFEGLVAESQNRWPSLRFDVGALAGLFAKLLPAGFYYKTFMWPGACWLGVYEKLIRRMGGMGRAPEYPDPERYETRYAHCDLLVVGAGPAGLSAAMEAGRSGARVILADMQSDLGGTLLVRQAKIDSKPGSEWVAGAAQSLAGLENVEVLTRTTIAGYYDHNYLVGLQRVSDHLPLAEREGAVRQRLWRIRAKRVVLATGAIERPLVFADNDRPGVMLASAVEAYINRFAVLPGRSLVVFTNNDSGYEAAFAAAGAGAGVEVIDLREVIGRDLEARARDKGVGVHTASAIVAVHGRARVRVVDVRALDVGGGKVVGPKRRIACDLVGMSGGWTPTVHLFCQARGTTVFRDDIAAFVPGAVHATMPNASAGAANGTFDLTETIEEGRRYARVGLGELGVELPAQEAPIEATGGAGPGRLRPFWTVPASKPLGHGRARHFHDFQNDSTAADLHLAAREGFRSVEHLKRYTTTGMGTDQGKTSNMNALGILSELRGDTIPEVGTTTFRPPFSGLTFGAVAGLDRGDFFTPQRKTPMHPWHEAYGAPMERAGDWLRPWYFPLPDEDRERAVQRECLAVRTRVGVADASTLGKIDLRGPDAAEFLNRIYTNAWSRLGIGRCRYGLMLNDQGYVFDDGVTTRLGDDHFHMTTTSGGVARVMVWLEDWLQTEWRDLKVYLTGVTDQWAVASLNGPEARAVLQRLTDMDLSREAFPFMSMREGRVAGVPARIFRISFTGELSFEINVPARYGMHLWEALMEAGSGFGIVAYGTEAMHVLRAEKRFIVVGQDTDGSVTPADLGMDRMVSGQKGDFLGRRSLSRPAIAAPGRRQLVGILTEDPDQVLAQGIHLTRERDVTLPARTEGFVSSTYWSPNLGRSIALGLVVDGRARHGEALFAQGLDGTPVPVQLTDSMFIDREGHRARA